MSVPGFIDLEKLRDGAMSIVYRARRESDALPVVLKVLKGTYSSPHALAQFEREHEITSRLSAPDIIETYGLEASNDAPAIVMEDFGGVSLDTVASGPKLPLESFLHLAVRMADAIAHVHQQNVIHKDINPSNFVWNATTQTLKLIDFGIASTRSRQSLDARNANHLEGTLPYISPEQTGRMNRRLDYRTDFYSLGATLYELLTGSPPFVANDALELVHAHIARAPVPPHELDSNVPRVVSDIVCKLLAKTAEDRYQSASGIKRDLEECVERIQREGMIAPFELGRGDVFERLEIPQKLYGREREVALLVDAFDRIARGSLELILVAGYAGVGKTSLVHEVHKPIVAQRGNFISGKFEQFNRGIPYASLIQAFQQFVRHVLTDREEVIDEWRSKLLEALGANARVMIDVIPELELILGDQPPVAELGPAEAENRLHEVVRGFVRVLAADHPLVLFLDDLQWADLPSIRLLERLASDPGTSRLLIIGAYRDNEVDGAHPFMLSLDEIHKSPTPVTVIELGPLDQENTRQLVADAHRRDLDQVASLADLCHERTLGNPFYLNQFLEGLHDAQLIRLDAATEDWHWDIAEIRARGITDNVVDFMAAKIRRLPPATQESLKRAAAIGNQFDLSLLAELRKATVPAAEEELQPALNEGLVLPVESDADAETVRLRYAFLHDRVQQTAYSLLSEAEKKAVHLEIGRWLLDRGDRDERIFDIVNHLNQGLELIESPAERDAVAKLNLDAGTRAGLAAAYQPAYAYVNAALRILDDDCWDRFYDDSLRLYTLAAELALLNADYGPMEQRIDTVLSRSKTVLERIPAYEVKINAHNARNDLSGAIDTALEVLRLLGVQLPREPGSLAVLRKLIHTKLVLARKNIEALPRLPEGQEARVAMRLTLEIISPAYFTTPNLVPILTCNLVTSTVRHGLAPESSNGFVIYGMILCSINSIDEGYAYGKLALRLADQFEDRRLRYIAYYIFNTHVRFWKEHFRDSVPHLRTHHQMLVENGEFKYGAFAAFMYCTVSFYASENLEQLAAEMDKYTEAIRGLKQETSGYTQTITHQAVLNLRGDTDDPSRLKGRVYDEDELLKLHQGANDRSNLFVFYGTKTMLAVLFRRPEAAIENAKKIVEYADGGVSTVFVPVFSFFTGLARVMAAEGKPPTERRELLKAVAAERKKLQLWSTHAPMNHGHRLHLIDAELARLAGKPSVAAKQYDAAIHAAHENGFINDVSLAYELAGRFHRQQGNAVVSKAYLMEARHAYQRWGATAKVKHLDAEVGELFPRVERAPAFDRGTGSDSGESLDIQAVTKASQAISAEIQRDKLLERMMRIVIENAGAERGLLVLKWLDLDDVPRIEAEATASDVTVGQSVPVSESEALSAGVVNYVLRTMESVVLSDAASEGDFTGDDYVQRARPRSVLCAPIKHGNLAGALYLENNLTTGAFTPDHLEVLRLLSAQAAISIENATLYNNLEEIVRERTEQLELRNEFITATFGRYVSGDVVESLLASPDALKMGGEKRKVSIVMADLRGFTSMAERLSPEKVVSTVNSFLSAMTDVILRYEGTVDAFLGDAVQAVFGVPLWRPSDAERAVACAIAMQQAMEDVNENNRKLGLPQVEMGIGINTEEVVVGNIGSEKRAKYGVVGGGVAVAVRIESYSVGGQVLIAESTLNDVGVDLRIDGQQQVAPKGISDPVTIYEVGGIGGKYQLYLPEPASDLEELAGDIEISYAILEGKAVASEEHRGRLVRVSSRRLAVAGASSVAPLTDVKIWVRDANGSRLKEALYGKVLRRDDDEFAVHLTSIPDAARDALGSYPRKA